LQEVYAGMKRKVLVTRAYLDAVFLPDPDRWDLLHRAGCDDEGPNGQLDELVQTLYADNDEFIMRWGDMDQVTRDKLGMTFTEEEWNVLTVEGSWQTGARLFPLTFALGAVERVMVDHLDMLESIVNGGALGDCDPGRQVRNQNPAHV
jgi:hypothetical protein